MSDCRTRNEVLFWPLATLASDERNGFCFQKEGLLFGWSFEIFEKVPIPTVITICGFILPFGDMHMLDSESNMKCSMESKVTMIKEVLASRKFGLKFKDDFSIKESFDSLTILGTWSPGGIDSKTFMNDEGVDIRNLPLFTSGPDGPCWFISDTDSSFIEKKISQITYYRPGHNYRLSRDSKEGRHNISYMHTILLRISFVESMRKETLFLLQQPNKKSICEKKYVANTDDSQALNGTNDISLRDENTSNFKKEKASLLKKVLLKMYSSSLTILHLSHRFKSDSVSTSKSKLVQITSPLILMIHSNHRADFSPVIAALIFDQLLGIFVGFFSIFYKHQIIQTFFYIQTAVFYLSYHEMVKICVSWLETFPVGFKLNVQLTKHMGKEIQMVVQSNTYLLNIVTRCIIYPFTLVLGEESIMQTKIHIASFILNLISFTSVFYGLSTVFSTFFDLLSLLTLHILIITRVFGKMYQIQVSTLSSLWLLFRGKKKNILRERTDSLEHNYDYMQLLLGILLFSICLFLFTTIFVYYIFFASLLGFVNSILVGVFWLGWLLIRGFSALGVWKRLKNGRKDEFSEKTHFQEIEHGAVTKEMMQFIANKSTKYAVNNTGKRIDIIIAQKKSLSSIILDGYKPYLLSFLNETVRFCIEYLSGHQGSVVHTCLEISRDLYK